MMNEKGNEMTEFEKNCYGMTQDNIRAVYMESLTARFSGLEMVVMSIMSDCQELLAMAGDKETVRESVRKQMNIAKFILSEMMDRRESEEMVLVSSDGKEIA
jgi:hypothetical protein